MKKTAMLQIMPLIIALAMTGCSTYRSVGIRHETTQPAPVYLTSPPLWKGDVVRYVLKDGRKGEIVVQSVSSSTLTGKHGDQVPLNQIITLERKEISGGKTAAATGAGLGIGAIVVVTVLSVGLATALIAAGG